MLQISNHLLFPLPFKDLVGNHVLRDDLSIGKGCFQLKVCCMDFRTHMKRQHALGWEQFFFSRLNVSSSSFMGNCKVFFRFLLIPSRSSRDILVVEDEDQPSPFYCSPVQGWIDQACEDASFHDFVPPSHLHELNSMIECGVVFVSAHDHFVLDLSLMWFIISTRVDILIKCWDGFVGYMTLPRFPCLSLG
jgi:hypothetical protein